MLGQVDIQVLPWSQRKVIDGRPTLPHPSLSAWTFWLSAFSGIPLEKKSALGLRFEGNELWASFHTSEYLRMVEAQAAPWENQLPLFIYESPGTPVGLMY